MFKKFEDLLRSVSYSVNDNNEPENITIMLSNGYKFNKGEIKKKFKCYQTATYALSRVVKS